MNIKNILCGAVLFLTASVANAALINGAVTLEGTFALNNTIGSATAFTGFSGVTVQDGTGDYAAFIGNNVTMNGFTFAPFSAVTPLWTIDGTTYGFDLNNLHIDLQNNTFLVLSGRGDLFDTSDASRTVSGAWSFSGDNLGGLFQFSSITAAPAPATIGLLGLGLMGLAMVRSRRNRNAA